MREIARLWNFASRQFVEMNTKIESQVESIKPVEEYKDFTERHK